MKRRDEEMIEFVRLENDVTAISTTMKRSGDRRMPPMKFAGAESG
uniref:Uncharacterized protein n=1 Tax=Parascaris univalens TaxID=6257 RepID=A0A915BJK4_PARUN